MARVMHEIEDTDPNLKDRKIFRVGDPAIWGSDGTESIGALFERQRIYFEKGDHARIDGKMQCHHRLSLDDEGRPSFQVFDTCHHFIRTVPSLVYSETHVEDVDTDGEDHCLTGDVMVWTEAGRKRIDELVGSSGRVYSHDGRLHPYSDVRKTQTNVHVYKVTLEDGSTVTATPNHRFLLTDGTWKRMDELEEGDDLWTIES